MQDVGKNCFVVRFLHIAGMGKLMSYQYFYLFVHLLN